MIFRDLEISMTGEHQIKNAVAALAALCILEERGEIDLPRTALYEGFKAAKQPGRLEVLAGETLTGGTLAGEAPTGSDEAKPLVILDGAHNQDGARVLKAAMEKFCKEKKILMVTGMLADKDVEAVTGYFRQITKDFVVTEPDNPRKMTAQALAYHMERHGARCTPEADLEQACRAALQRADREGFDVVLFAGSLYLIGAVRGILRRLLEEKQI